MLNFTCFELQLYCNSSTTSSNNLSFKEILCPLSKIFYKWKNVDDIIMSFVKGTIHWHIQKKGSLAPSHWLKRHNNKYFMRTTCVCKRKWDAQWIFAFLQVVFVVSTKSHNAMTAPFQFWRSVPQLPCATLDWTRIFELVNFQHAAFEAFITFWLRKSS